MPTLVKGLNGVANLPREARDIHLYFISTTVLHVDIFALCTHHWSL